MTALGAEALVEEPRRLEDATEPPEARGLRRDEVRLLVASDDGIQHARFFDVARFLRRGDLVVVNVSQTVPAAIDGIRADSRWTVVHLSAPLEDGIWTVELREPDASGPQLDSHDGEHIELYGGARLEVLSAYPQVEGYRRILRASLEVEGSVDDHLLRFGRPISYCYVQQRWPLSMYQTVFARDPGSAEMPSAGRPFTAELVTELISRGVSVAPITLHTGVSSQEAGEAPLPERFQVAGATARLVNLAHLHGGRVIAVGTTVTRALESAADDGGTLAPAQGWTNLVLGPDRPARVVDGLITGWHAPEASHIDLLRAVVREELVERAYQAAHEEGYLWHEFGDSCLFLPAGRRGR